MPLLFATLRSYPRQQAWRSWSNFVELLTTVGPWNFWSFGDLTPERLDAVLPGLGEQYPLTKQAHSALPQAIFRSLQTRALEVSMLAVAILLPWTWHRRLWELLGLAGTVLIVVPMNALLCGVISCNDPRLQDRSAWMVACWRVCCWLSGWSAVDTLTAQLRKSRRHRTLHVVIAHRDSSSEL